MFDPVQWLAIRVFQALVNRMDEVDRQLAHYPGAAVGGVSRGSDGECWLRFLYYNVLVEDAIVLTFCV